MWAFWSPFMRNFSWNYLCEGRFLIISYKLFLVIDHFVSDQSFLVVIAFFLARMFEASKINVVHPCHARWVIHINHKIVTFVSTQFCQSRVDATIFGFDVISLVWNFILRNFVLYYIFVHGINPHIRNAIYGYLWSSVECIGSNDGRHWTKCVCISNFIQTERVKTMSMDKGSTRVLEKNKALFEMWK